MTNAVAQQNISSAVQEMRNAENALTIQINAAPDALSAIKLNHAYQHIDSCLSQLLQLQNVQDDATFKSSVTTLKAQTTALTADENSIKGLIADINEADKVVGYIGQALTFIAAL
jgi:hypothetical protein